MRRNLRILFLILFLCPFWAYGQEDHGQEVDSSMDYKTLGSPMPELILETRHGEIKTPFSGEVKGPFLVFMFNPTCDHCQQVAISLRQKQLDTLGTQPIVWLSSPQMPPGHLEFFNSVTKIDSTDMLMGRDQTDFISKSFLYGGLPQLNIYDDQKLLIRQFPGNIPVDSLVHLIIENRSQDPVPTGNQDLSE